MFCVLNVCLDSDFGNSNTDKKMSELNNSQFSCVSLTASLNVVPVASGQVMTSNSLVSKEDKVKVFVSNQCFCRKFEYWGLTAPDMALSAVTDNVKTIQRWSSLFT